MTHMLLLSKHWLENLRKRENKIARNSQPLAKAGSKAEYVQYGSCQIRLIDLRQAISKSHNPD